MFSGLVQACGTVTGLRERSGGRRIVVAAAEIAGDVQPGDSVCVSGVCLTATARSAHELEFDVVPETLRRTTLQTIAAGEAVNLELSIRAGERLGGHLVYGHVDAIAEVLGCEAAGQGKMLRVALPEALRACIVEKGAIALDGVSLTVAAVEDAAFTVALIPETLARTTLAGKDAGSRLNVEIDPIARYVAGALEAQGRNENLELEWAYEI